MDSQVPTQANGAQFGGAMNRNVTNFNMQHNKLSRGHSPMGYATAENGPTRAVS